MIAEMPLLWFRWWFKGITPDGTILKLSGHIQEVTPSMAASQIDVKMRAAYPAVRWMQGRQVENFGSNRGVSFGPTVQQMKRGPK